jgi:5-methyltetrahydropteroyltriglutamate--homocysteine methyltransferase
MQRSTGHIRTTHTGSLPRPAGLLELLQAREAGAPPEPQAFEQRTCAAVREVVKRQRTLGLSVVNDGEMSKPDYSTYIKYRLSGFEGEADPPSVSRDARDFPEFFAEQSAYSAKHAYRPSCTGPIAWRDFAAVKADIGRLAAAITAQAEAEATGGAAPPGGPPEAFMTAVSPGQAARFLPNRYYPSHQAYLEALAAVLKDEYEAIAQAGFILQVDCPDLASGWNNQFADLDLAQFRSMVGLHLEVLDEATRNVPPEQLRLHLCWGNYPGPHHHDIALREIIGPVLRSRATAVSFEGANARHEHEWAVFGEIRLPEGKMIIPGVLDSTSNFIEHPELIAQRLCRYAARVGRENLIAGTDCGFATFAGRSAVHPQIAWAKLGAMVEGAALASARLWP